MIEPATTPLSPREREILVLFGDGLSRPDVARRVGITPRGVTAALERIFAKLGAVNLGHALVLAWRRGEVR